MPLHSMDQMILGHFNTHTIDDFNIKCLDISGCEMGGCISHCHWCCDKYLTKGLTERFVLDHCVRALFTVTGVPVAGTGASVTLYLQSRSRQ